MGISFTHAHTLVNPGDSRQNAPLQLSRRTLAKATAGFLAMASAGKIAGPMTATAQETETARQGTLAGEWIQPDSVGGGDSLAFEADFAFNAVAPNWPGDTPFPAAVEIQLSNDGVTWSDPVVVGPAHTDAGPIDRDGRVFADLVFTEEASIVRYRGLDADGNVIAIPGLAFTYINAKAGPSISDIGSTVGTPSKSRPPIIGRGDWGAELAYGGADHGEVEWIPSYETVRHVIIHHSETPQFRDPLVEIRSIHYYHSITRGWGDIGYNYLVDYLGNVYEGRAGGENVVGGHAFQYARGSAGICTMGSFSMESSTPEAIAGLTWITAWAARNLDPLARSDFHQTPNLPTICGHRDVVDSSCPGDGLYADLPTIRWAAADVISGAREVLTDPEFSPGQAVTTTTEDANMRQLPGTDQQVVGTIPLGAVLHVTDGPTSTDDHTWYQLSGTAGSGWMSASFLAATDQEPPTGRFAIGDRLQVDTDFLNIRQEASIQSEANATIPYATLATVTDGPNPTGGYRWYKVETDYGTGWAVEQYLTPEGELKPQTRFVVGDTVAVSDRAGVRLRTGPGLGSQVIVTLPWESLGTVVGNARVSDGITWIEIHTGYGTGWAGESYFEASNAAPSTPARFERGDQVRVNTGSVNLREGPGTDQPVIRSLGNGITGTVSEPPSEESNLYWARIDTEYGIGWVAEAFLEYANGEDDSSSSNRTFSIGDTVYVDTDGINLRTEPGTDVERVVILYANETATVIDGPFEDDGHVWYQLESAQGTGWGASRFLALGTADPGTAKSLAVGDIVAVDTDGINLRETAGLSGTPVVVIYNGTQGTVVDGPVQVDGYSWFHLETTQGSGWGVATYLSRDLPTFAIGTQARVIDGDLNLRESGSTGAENVGVLADGAIVEVLEGPVANEGFDWVRVSSSRYGVGWCVTEYLARI
jgi:uncharacterized protein YgiM (DUF1202 family)